MKRHVTDRKEIQRECHFVKRGRLRRMLHNIARNTKDLLNIVEQLEAKHVKFISLKENIDTSTAEGRFLLTVFGAVAQLERESMLERQREGIILARLMWRRFCHQLKLWQVMLWASGIIAVSAYFGDQMQAL